MNATNAIFKTCSLPLTFFIHSKLLELGREYKLLLITMALGTRRVKTCSSRNDLPSGYRCSG